MDTRLEFRPIQADSGDTVGPRTRRQGVFRNTGPPPERRSTISNVMPSSNFQNTRMRNLSGGSNGSTASGSSSGSSLNLDNQYSDNHFTFVNVDSAPFGNNSSAIQQIRMGGTSTSHRKLDRSLSDSDSDRLSNGCSSSHRSVNSSRYKTELCRPFEESGSCKYGDKCQFAHGYHELRNLARHPKYKTELCRTFHTIGFCPYGPRCHFIHEDDGKVNSEPSPKPGRPAPGRASSNYTPTSNSGSSSPSLSPSGSDNDYSAFTYQLESTPHMPAKNADDNQFCSLSVNINTYGSNNNIDLQTVEQFNSVLTLSKNSANDNAGNNVFGGVFTSGSTKRDPRPIGSEEYDIFSEVTMFNSEEVKLDNAPKAPSTSVSPYSMQSVKLDNFSYVDTNLYWQSCENALSQSRPVDPFHHSPTGSMGSDGSGSDCSGSTESLASSGCRDNLGPFCRDNVASFSPFSQWISGF
ncbi:CCCH-type zinc finger protein moe-3 [Aplysia californica]|uniref:CCCH-type zinc finger protein moe-3 n=1 Tax=Aplysia californica TaxID=6500 RepID=A0ABM0K7W4_APLCA|nr:CCCH-type zinc finger protein moe-3 [Aplysia californica]